MKSLLLALTAAVVAVATGSAGIRHVLANDVHVVSNGDLQEDVAPGQPIRAVR